MAILKLDKSNRAHERIGDYYHSLKHKLKENDPRKFWANVKADYHFSVLDLQESHYKIADISKRKNIFKTCVEREISFRKNANLYRKFPLYIPKSK